ncbi:MAG: hypothetical protein IJ523_10805 [Succinivibrionaceae bacterium]|nr:hypothetical protein [Succinivibrionaceae bacterium]
MDSFEYKQFARYGNTAYNFLQNPELPAAQAGSEKATAETHPSARRKKKRARTRQIAAGTSAPAPYPRGFPPEFALAEKEGNW